MLALIYSSLGVLSSSISYQEPITKGREAHSKVSVIRDNSQTCFIKCIETLMTELLFQKTKKSYTQMNKLKIFLMQADRTSKMVLLCKTLEEKIQFKSYKMRWRGVYLPIIINLVPLEIMNLKENHFGTFCYNNILTIIKIQICRIAQTLKSMENTFPIHKRTLIPVKKHNRFKHFHQ